jgi:hypothetical protein
VPDKEDRADDDCSVAGAGSNPVRPGVLVPERIPEGEMRVYPYGPPSVEAGSRKGVAGSATTNVPTPLVSGHPIGMSFIRRQRGDGSQGTLHLEHLTLVEDCATVTSPSPLPIVAA